jgi:hypothetical protein
MRCRVADEPVVVMKFRPVKAREGVEDKTGMTRRLIGGDGRWPKSVGWMRRGEVYVKAVGVERRWFWRGKRLDRVGTWFLASRERGRWGLTVLTGVGRWTLDIAALADRTQGNSIEEVRTKPRNGR